MWDKGPQKYYYRADEKSEEGGLSRTTHSEKIYSFEILKTVHKKSQKRCSILYYCFT